MRASFDIVKTERYNFYKLFKYTVAVSLFILVVLSILQQIIITSIFVVLTIYLILITSMPRRNFEGLFVMEADKIVVIDSQEIVMIYRVGKIEKIEMQFKSTYDDEGLGNYIKIYSHGIVDSYELIIYRSEKVLAEQFLELWEKIGIQISIAKT